MINSLIVVYMLK